MISVLLVDDQRLMRNGMRTLLSLEPDLTVVGEAGDGREALMKVLILTTFDDDALVLEALREGAAGYLTKDEPAEEIASAVRKAQSGRVIMPPPIAAKVVASLTRQAPLLPPAELAELTEREHVSSIMEKLRLRDRTQTALWAVRHGLAE
ncbi:MAG TPA: response regulator transcription factor [Symbiobacteriaceae bacterium]|jgi:DNA-binding NarL/FixJ family response regulator